MARRPCVYILCNRPRGTLYIGVTSRASQRVSQHKAGLGGAFAAKYRLTRLVYAEFHPTMRKAILREKQLKEWQRAWKVRLIEEVNPEWRDLSCEL